MEGGRSFSYVLCRLSKLIIMDVYVLRFLMFYNCNREGSGRENKDQMGSTWLSYFAFVISMTTTVLIQSMIIC